MPGVEWNDGIGPTGSGARSRRRPSQGRLWRRRPAVWGDPAGGAASASDPVVLESASVRDAPDPDGPALRLDRLASAY